MQNQIEELKRTERNNNLRELYKKAQAVKMEGKEIKASSLNKKIIAIMRDVETIAEDGKNTFHGYSYASAKAIIGKVRKAMIANSVTISSVETGPGKFLSDGVYEYLMKYSLTDVDTGETQSYTIPAMGQDVAKTGKLGDKGAYQALTGSMKYFLRTAFMLSIGWSDPEDDEGNQDYLNTDTPPPATPPPTDAEILSDGKQKFNGYEMTEKRLKVIKEISEEYDKIESPTDKQKEFISQLDIYPTAKIQFTLNKMKGEK